MAPTEDQTNKKDFGHWLTTQNNRVMSEAGYGMNYVILRQEIGHQFDSPVIHENQNLPDSN
jgi:hypothetical protein